MLICALPNCYVMACTRNNKEIFLSRFFVKTIVLV